MERVVQDDFRDGGQDAGRRRMVFFICNSFDCLRGWARQRWEIGKQSIFNLGSLFSGMGWDSAPCLQDAHGARHDLVWMW